MRQIKLTAFCHPPGHWRMPGAVPQSGSCSAVSQAKKVHAARIPAAWTKNASACAPDRISVACLYAIGIIHYRRLESKTTSTFL